LKWKGKFREQRGSRCNQYREEWSYQQATYIVGRNGLEKIGGLDEEVDDLLVWLVVGET